MKKIIIFGGGAIVAAVIAMVVLAVLNLGDIVKTVTETYGPKITKTEVRLGSADISVLSGSGTLEDFFLGNPAGFSMPGAMQCDTIRIKVVNESLTTDRIIIEEIYVDGPIISYEKKGNTDNFKTIVNNINKSVGSEKKAEQKPAEDSADGGTQKKIQINNFIVKNGKINLGGSLLNSFGDEGVGIDLPDIHMKDIGKEKDTSPAEAFALILKEMTGDITSSVTQVGKQLMEGVGKAVEGASDQVESIGGAVKGLFGD